MAVIGSGVRAFWLTVLLAFCGVAHADLHGSVVAILDGDTIDVLVDRKPVRVRLSQIDAPEKRQPFGQRSKQSLSDLCFGQDALIEDKGYDRYGRIVGRVSCASVDASIEQVRRGMAWIFDRYATDRSLYAIQEEARVARRGLWNDAAPVPPWEYRAALSYTRVTK